MPALADPRITKDPGLGAAGVGSPRGRARTAGRGRAVADHPGRPGPRRVAPGTCAVVHGAPAAGALRAS